VGDLRISGILVRPVEKALSQKRYGLVKRAVKREESRALVTLQNHGASNRRRKDWSKEGTS